jgi:hypothetical protein
MQGMMDGVGRIDMVGLTYGEHLMIWGLRRIVTGRGVDGLFLDECRHAFGDDGADAAGGICLFLCLLGRSARRVFEIGSPGALVLTRDERQILTLLAAAQADDEAGDQIRLQAHLRWVATPAHRPALVRATMALARLLAVHGHWLSSGAWGAPADVGTANLDASVRPLRH